MEVFVLFMVFLVGAIFGAAVALSYVVYLLDQNFK